MKRRDLLRSVPAGLIAAKLNHLMANTPAPTRWRTFVIQTRVEVIRPSGETRIWLPAAMPGKTAFQHTLAQQISAVGGHTIQVVSRPDNMGIIAAKFPAGVLPVLTVTSRVATKNIAIDFAAPAKPQPEARAQLQHFLRPTKLIPTDGIVRETAIGITRGANTDLEKAKAIYNWIVDNTFRDPKARGCGLGDIRFMLESRDLGGKCADLNSLFVGLARSSGLPARDVFGIRTAKSELGYKSLGTSSETITKAQHCRAEVYLTGYGWVPVDPADVRKVVLEEPPGHRAVDDQLVAATRTRLFGSWEMNWIAYNFAHDVQLPGSTGAPVGFLMYPQAETSGTRLDSLDPATFKYEISAHEIG